MSTIFTKIILGQIPCYKVAENEHFFAFLDINPRTEGHTLVVPKQEIDYIFDMSNSDFSAYLLFAKRVAKAIESSVACCRIAVSVVGLEVPHAHIHLIPIQAERDLSVKFSKPEPERMSEIASKIKANFN